MPTPSFFTCSDGSRLAYERFIPPAATGTGVLFLGGFYSDMQGSKAVFLDERCREAGIPFTRFDYFGHGQSDGAFTDGTIGRWKQDVLNILDHCTEGKQIVIGSSMGGWLALLAAMARPERVAALLGIAAAPDFTEYLLWDMLNDAAKRQIMEQGMYQLPTEYCNDPTQYTPYPITRQLIEEARNHMILQGTIPITCPISLLHGMQDADVPYSYSLKIAEKIAAEQATVTLLKHGEHRMSDPESLEKMWQMVVELREKVAEAG